MVHSHRSVEGNIVWKVGQIGSEQVGGTKAQERAESNCRQVGVRCLGPGASECD